MKFYFNDWNNLMTDLKAAVGPENLASPADADVMVMYADTRGPLRELAERSKMMGKKVYVIQHGRAASRDYQAPLNAKLIADKYLCWGDADLERMKRLGYEDRTVLVGCPLLKKLRPKVQHSEKNVLFIPVNSDHEQPENLLVYYELLKHSISSAQSFLAENAEALHESWDWNRRKGVAYSDMCDYTLIAKVLPSHAKLLYHGNVIESHPGSPTHMEQVFDILSNVDCVVSLDESTTEILAMAMDVPVLVCDEFRWRKLGGSDYSDVELIRTPAASRSKLHNLTYMVDEILMHPETNREERANVAQWELGIGKGDAVQNILREIGFVKESVA